MIRRPEHKVRQSRKGTVFYMKNVLVIGSTVVDVIINVPHLPKTQEDVHVIHQRMSLGGCAYNTSDTIRHFGVPYILFTPIGTGAYGDFVRKELGVRGIVPPIPSPEAENGCCYCFVENTGERTFISYHGAEYRFQKEWFDALNPEEIDTVYICGLEIEEPTGPNIVAWLEEHPDLTLYFAPGPRINRIDSALLDRIFALHPVLHLNEEEACSFVARQTASDGSHASQNGVSCEPNDPAGAAAALYRLTGNAVIVTLGEKGTFYYDVQESAHIPGVPATQIDTIGAGDSHIGAVISVQKLGLSLRDAIAAANRVASRVVETEGALLPDDVFSKLELLSPAQRP